MDTKYNNTDNREIKPINENKPFIQSITIETIIDNDCVDLSFLTQLYEYIIDSNEREKYLAEDKARLDSYYNQSWDMIGIKAYAVVYIPIGNDGFMTQRITSGGLWGIESDSDKSYIEDIKNEQINELKQYLALFNIDMPENIIIKETYQ